MSKLNAQSIKLELAQMLEANHTPNFWSIVRAKVPGAEKSKVWLKENGQLFEEEI